ncbi:MAG TPA: hypothetical protein VFA52_04330 [Candidatus Paceibacterota bacterium]|jgi:hypothetical protein|nr:hypothetical protein [Candidatus Paceibacterota bacterium]
MKFDYYTWFKTHERLVLFLVIGFFVVHFYNRGLDYMISRDRTAAEAAKQNALEASNKFNQDDQKNKVLLAQLDVLRQQFITQQKQLDQIRQQRAEQTQKQKQINDQSAPTELAERIRQLLGVGTITVQTQESPLPDTLVFSLDAAHADADMLEDMQQLRGDVKDLNTELVSCKALTDKQADTITGLNAQILSGKEALTAEQKSHEKDVKELKAEKRKSWLNGFKWGSIAGFVGGLFAHKL